MTYQQVDEQAWAAVRRLRIPKEYREDARHEAVMAITLGYDTGPWLRYWWNKLKSERQRRPLMYFVDPHLLDQQLLDGTVFADDFNEEGLRFDEYHGWVRDDV